MNRKAMCTTMARATEIATPQQRRLTIADAGLRDDLRAALPIMGPARVVPIAPLPDLRLGRPRMTSVPKPPPLRRTYAAPEMKRIARMMALVKLMLRVEDQQRRPGPSQATVGRWLATKAEWIDRPDEKTVVRPRPATAEEITVSGEVFELVQALRCVDEFMATVVVARALGVRWRNLTNLDPKHRQRDELRYVYLTAVWELVKLDAARKNLVDKADIFRHV